MNFLKNRFLPVVLAITVILTVCVVPVGAEWDSRYDEFDVDSVSVWSSRLYTPLNASMYAEKLGMGVSASITDVFWNYVDTVIWDDVGLVSLGELRRLADVYNGYFNRPNADSFIKQLREGTSEFLTDCFGLAFLGRIPSFEVRYIEGSKQYRIYCPEVGAWLVNSAGQYAYAVSEPTEEDNKSDTWIGETTAADRANTEIATATLDDLNLLCLRLRDAGIPAQIKTLGSNYKCIWYNRMVYADCFGIPYLAWFDEKKAAVNQERPETDIILNGDEIDVIGTQTNLDLENMVMYLPNGDINIIDRVIYDESTKTYHVDSHDTYNTTVNNYYTWNYYINYTSVTYIGQTEEYNKYYEVYYELPDGRDSADLTKEDLEQLNLSVDVIPYGRSADDTSLRSLYHFDGDTRDSSYWNYCTDFIWNTGASLTYMDAGVFDGALYLDEQEHDFTLTLPSNVTSGDFTLQFRYYQSATAAPQTDSYVKIGGVTIMQFNGGSFLNASGTAMANTPVGTWNEVAMMRVNGTVYYYLNGVCIGSAGIAGALSNTVNFHFGSTQQTFKYFDEFRFLNYALCLGGANYPPTAVPHDTNLSLVLPDSVAPVADEYWSFVSSGTNLFKYDLMSGVSAGFASVGVQGWDDQSGCTRDYMTQGRGNTYPTWGYCDDAMSFSYYAGYATFNNFSDKPYFYEYGAERYRTRQGLATQLWWNSTTNPNNIGAEKATYLENGTYTLSVVLSDGTVSTFTFTTTFNSRNFTDNYVTFDWGKIGTRTFYGKSANGYYLDTCQYLYIEPSVNTSVDIMYIELVAGDSTDLEVEWVESVTLLDKDDLNTPTLAVRTDTDITSYQIGGARPSVPEKGMVWALVENERIVSIQIYNGQAWEGVDGRIWTGSRWVPASSYNIVTLQDMYDIVDATPDYEYIYTESGFWSWWQKSWNAFTEKFFSVFGSGGSGGTVSPDKMPTTPDDETTEEDDSWTLIDLLIVLKDGTWKIITGVVTTAYDGFSGFVESVSSAGGFFEPYRTDGENSIWLIPLEEGATVWD